MTPEQIAKFACEVLYNKKASDIITLDIRDMTVFSDYYVLASGKSTTQVKALAENVDERLSEQGFEPKRREGLQDGRWAILDYGDVVIHIFNDEMRTFYCLERLWENGSNLVRYKPE